MSWTKQQLVEEAYGELALAGYAFDITPDEMQTGLRRLDTMMAMWCGKGISLGYPLPSSPKSSSLDSDSNLPTYAIEPVFMNLAMRLAAGMGKQVLPTTVTAAKDGYDMLTNRAAMPSEVQYQETMPRGAGNKPWRYQRGPFVTPPVDPLTAGNGDEIEFN